MNYLYTIVNKENDELVKDIYEAQKISPMEGDFCKLIEADKEEINLQISETEISQMKESKYKSLVKNKIQEAAFKNLLEIKNNHSKMKNVVYQKHELQPYLCSPLFGSEDIEMLLALRTRTVRGVKSDFRGMNQDEECPLGCGNKDTIPNIITCPALKNCFKSEALINHQISYEDIFSTNIMRFKYPLLDGQQVRAPGWSAGARTWTVSRCTPISLMVVHPRVHLYIMYTPSRHPLDYL